MADLDEVLAAGQRRLGDLLSIAENENFRFFGNVEFGFHYNVHNNGLLF